MADAPSADEARFLEQLNARVPAGIDWKAGAVSYLRDLVQTRGAHNKDYHFVKPFLGGPDFTPFFVEMFLFLDVIQRLELPMKSTIVDVGCGPGWTTHYLAKLGHHVIGLDISPELLDIARERVADDSHPPFPDTPLAVEFVEHDIEEAPLAIETPATLAFFESVLHHFYNPIAVLRNVREMLEPDGLVAIIEAAAPAHDSHDDREARAIMDSYHTLERPFTRAELMTILRLAGLEHFEFFQPINGLFRQERSEARMVRAQIVADRSLNIVIASANRAALDRVLVVSRATPAMPASASLARRAYRKARRTTRKVAGR